MGKADIIRIHRKLWEELAEWEEERKREAQSLDAWADREAAKREAVEWYEWECLFAPHIHF